MDCLDVENSALVSKTLPCSEGGPGSVERNACSKGKPMGDGAQSKATPAFLICITAGGWYQTLP